MVIQHNIPALNARRHLGINTTAVTKDLEKLSSGLRINRAADDAAGLAISEKMRNQIRGLEMAEQNAKNGISLIQTAEGALSETHSILARMRELAVQSSNGTYQDEDRAQITEEFEALKSEIDRIAESTHYNNIKLLDGSLSGGSVGNSGYTITTTEKRLVVADVQSSGNVGIPLSADSIIIGPDTPDGDYTLRLTHTGDPNTYTYELLGSSKVDLGGDSPPDRLVATGVQSSGNVGTPLSADSIEFDSDTPHGDYMLRLTHTGTAPNTYTYKLLYAPTSDRDEDELAAISIHSSGNVGTPLSADSITVAPGTPTGDSTLRLTHTGTAPNTYTYELLDDSDTVIATQTAGAAGNIDIGDFSLTDAGAALGYGSAGSSAADKLNITFKLSPANFQADANDPTKVASYAGETTDFRFSIVTDRIEVDGDELILTDIQSSGNIDVAIPLTEDDFVVASGTPNGDYTLRLTHTGRLANNYTYELFDDSDTLIAYSGSAAAEIIGLSGFTITSAGIERGYGQDDAVAGSNTIGAKMKITVKLDPQNFEAGANTVAGIGSYAGKFVDIKFSVYAAIATQSAGAAGDIDSSGFSLTDAGEALGYGSAGGAPDKLNLTVKLTPANFEEDANDPTKVASYAGKITDFKFSITTESTPEEDDSSDAVLATQGASVAGDIDMSGFSLTNAGADYGSTGSSAADKLNILVKLTPENFEAGANDPAKAGSYAGKTTDFKFSITTESTTEGSDSSGKGVTFQIGANGGQDQRVALRIGDMSSKALGESTVDARYASVTGMTVADASVGSIEDANKAIDILDGATQMVSAQRANLGAMQNRLESTLNSLGVSIENLSAAESIIRDTDMAKGMMNFTMNQIKLQAAQAMLAQANSLPQGVLQLLR